MHRDHDPFVDHAVYLGQIVTLVLIDDKQIPRNNGIEPVVDEELLSSGNGEIDLTAVMDVHVHGLLFFVKMGHRKCTCLHTAFGGQLATGKFFHGNYFNTKHI